MVSSNKKVRWGILSTARIGLRAVIPAIQQSTNGTVVAIASRDGDRAREIANSLGIPSSYESYGELLDSPDIDAVYIPLPNSMHRVWTIRSAEKGKHVLCEKPLALNASECEEMISVCLRYGVWLMEAFMYRFHPQIVKLKEMVESGDIGKVSVIRSAFRTGLENLQDIRFQLELGGGALMDVGCYCVNVMRLLTGTEPTYVRGVARFHEEKGVDEALAGTLRFPNLELGSFDCAFRSQYQQAVEVVGEKGNLELPAPFLPENSPVILRKIGETTETIICETANHYRLMAEHFSDCVLNDHEPLYPPADGLNNMRAIDMLYQSARSLREDCPE